MLLPAKTEYNTSDDASFVLCLAEEASAEVIHLDDADRYTVVHSQIEPTAQGQGEGCVREGERLPQLGSLRFDA